MSKFLGRRQFTFGAAIAAATSLVLPANLLAQPFAADGPPDSESPDEKARTAMAKLSASAQAEVEMKVASIFRKYGDRLSEEQKADIRRIMAEGQEGLEKMRAFHLENSDQPADAFRAYLADATPHQAKSHAHQLREEKK
ncbi:MAG TPA: hypothetical protein VH724_18750 [Candidatus Angelobacter sp.]|nr:hypothetical protein [Candidatus Angelobacter sp.]